MSTCPNKDIFSAYTDGELASPWKETIELHLKKCSVCRDIYEHYDVLNRCIKAASAEPVFDTEASFTRLLAKRDIALAVKQAQKKRWGRTTGVHWFYSSIHIPIPAVAAAVFVFVLMPLVFFLKAEYTVASVAAFQSSFTPILPVSLEKQMSISEMDYGVCASRDSQEAALLTKSVLNTNTKLFMVGEFARLYSKDGHLFRPVQSAVDLKITSSSFPLVTEYKALYSRGDSVSANGNR